MATLAQINAIANSTELRNRVRAALTRKITFVRVNDIATENTYSTERKAKRQALAIALVLSADAYVIPMARLIADDGTLQGQCTYGGADENTTAVTTGITDGNIINVVDSKYDFIAGVLPSEIP